MAFTTDGTCVVKMEYSDEEISAVTAESGRARKHLRKLGKVTETVAAYRLKEMKNLQVVEKLATWRRAHGYDRIGDGDNQRASRLLPLTPEQFTASLWFDLKALKDTISMPPVRDGFSQRARVLLRKLDRAQ